MVMHTINERFGLLILAKSVIVTPNFVLYMLFRKHTSEKLSLFFGKVSILLFLGIQWNRSSFLLPSLRNAALH